MIHTLEDWQMNSNRTLTFTMMACTAMLALLLAVGCRTNETPENQVTDAKILTDVKAKLAEGIGASSVTNISVNATNGVVTLSGTVHNSAEQAKAVEIAKSVPKVTRVNDSLQITGGT
jgi:hyperosmotically inducible protein